MSAPLSRVAIRVPAGDVEAALAHLLELSPGGVEQVDLGDSVELAAYAAEPAAAALARAFPGAVATPVDPGWVDAWRAFHRPAVAGGIWIGPPWLEPPAGHPAVVIDPGRAFGTGAHPTTRLCVELLAEVPAGSVLDVGCGSGVLSIAAARLGHAPLLAVDVDPVAVEVTRANAGANGVEVDARVADATAGPLPPADAAVANIELAAVERLLPHLRTAVAITSGYLASDRLAAPGWEHVERRELDGWAADLLRSTAARATL